MCAVPNIAIICSSLISRFFWYVAQVFSGCFRDESSYPYCYWYHFCFHIPCALILFIRSSYFKIISASQLNTFLSPKFTKCIDKNIHFFVITDYNVQFIVRDGSVGLHLLIPKYGYLTFITCLDWFWYMVISVLIYYYYYYYYYLKDCKLPQHVRSYFTLVNKLPDYVTCLLQTGTELTLHSIWHLEFEPVPDGPLHHSVAVVTFLTKRHMMQWKANSQFRRN
jgi:hypothetical protein